MLMRIDRRSSLLGATVIGVLGVVSVGCGDGGGSKGSGRTIGGCGADTKGQCDLVNGSFSKGKSCVVASRH